MTEIFLKMPCFESRVSLMSLGLNIFRFGLLKLTFRCGNEMFPVF